MSRVTIRKATARDRELIYTMICDLEHTSLNQKQFNRIFDANLRDPDVHYLLLLEAGKPIGFGSLQIQRLLHHTGNVGEIQELYVLPEYRRAGMGRLLLDRLRQIALQRQCVNLEVAANRKRRKAHIFYVREGFEKSHYKFVEEL